MIMARRMWIAGLLCGISQVLGEASVFSAATNVQVGPPPVEEASKDYAVTVGGTNVPVYVARVQPTDPVKAAVRVAGEYPFELVSFCSFDMNAAVQVTVTCPGPIRSAKVLPISSKIIPTLQGQKLTFNLPSPRLLTIECNGQTANVLHLFANPVEADPPHEGDPGVIYFGPGVHEMPTGLTVGDGQTVYLAPGAILRGIGAGAGAPIISLVGKNIKLRGRGIIDGSLCPDKTRHLLSIKGSDISVEGIILRDSSPWNLPIRQSDRVVVDNVKILGYRANSDGIDICNSRDVVISGCFLRTSDDLIVVKADHGGGKVEHVVVKNCVLWNPFAHALSLGAELRDPVDDVLFTDCDVLHDTGRAWTLGIYQCDAAVVSHIRFESIRIEDSPRPISLLIVKDVWSRDIERGHIQDVTFKDIRVHGPEPLLVNLQGADATHLIDGVKFENVRLDNQPLTNANLHSNQFVKDVTIVQD